MIKIAEIEIKISTDPILNLVFTILFFMINIPTELVSSNN